MTNNFGMFIQADDKRACARGNFRIEPSKNVKTVKFVGDCVTRLNERKWWEGVDQIPECGEVTLENAKQCFINTIVELCCLCSLVYQHSSKRITLTQEINFTIYISLCSTRLARDEIFLTRAHHHKTFQQRSIKRHAPFFKIFRIVDIIIH